MDMKTKFARWNGDLYKLISVFAGSATLSKTEKVPISEDSKELVEKTKFLTVPFSEITPCSQNKVIGLSDCKICMGWSKNKCWFCGKKRPKKSQMTHLQLSVLEGVEELERWLTAVKSGCKKFNMPTTGCQELDEAVKKQFGIIDLSA